MNLAGILLRIVPVLFMLGIVLVTRLGAGRERRRREIEDRDRLRFGLRAELAAVRAVLEDNLHLIATDALHVVSARGFFLLLRANAGRLSTLGEAELTALLAVHAANERLDALLAIHGKPSGPNAYRLPAGNDALAELGRAVRQALAAVESAAAVLADPAPAPPPPEREPRRGAAAPEIALALPAAGD